MHGVKRVRLTEQRTAAPTARLHLSGKSSSRLHRDALVTRRGRDAREHLLDLQATAGNYAVHRLLSSDEVARRQTSDPPTLRVGAAGPAVVELQQRLVEHGASVVIDGRFGPQTRASVVAFQSESGLSPDGVVGPRTWAALASGPAGPTERSAPPELIALLQARLDQVLTAVRSIDSTGSVQAAVAPVALRALQRQDDDEDVLDTLGETVGEIVGGIGETVGEIVGGIGETVGEIVGDTVNEAWQGVQQRASELQRQLEIVSDEGRRRFGPQLALVEQAVADLGRGVRLDGFQVGRILAVLEELVKQVELTAALTTGTFEDDVKITTSQKQISGTGLSEIHTAATKAMGASTAGHVTLAPDPRLVTSLDSDGAVNAAKVTVRGIANVPVAGNIKQKFTVDPTVTGDRKTTQEKMAAEEREGINSYFTLAQAHEAEHVKRYNSAFTGLAKSLEGKTDAAAGSAFNDALCAARNAQADLDDQEGCLVISNERFVAKAGASNCALTTSRCKKT